MASTSNVTISFKTDTPHLTQTLDAIARHAQALADELRQINNPDTPSNELCIRCNNPLDIHIEPCR